MKQQQAKLAGESPELPSETVAETMAGETVPRPPAETEGVLDYGEWMDNMKRRLMAMMGGHLKGASHVKRAGLDDLAGFVPGGGVLQGVLRPETGASRGETMLLGGGGSVLGALLGGLLAATATARPAAGFPPGPGPRYTVDPLITLAGASLGSGAGNMLGRWLARHQEKPDAMELLDEIARLRAAGGSGVTIHIGGGAPVRREETESEENA